MIKANFSKLVLIAIKKSNAMANGFITNLKKIMVFAKVALKMKK